MSVPRYWREIPQRYNLQSSHCGICDGHHYPPRSICPTCRRESIGHISLRNLSGRGKVLEWTRVHKPAAGYEMQTPYIVALIETDEGPRIVGQVVDNGGADLSDGARVQAAFRRIGSDGDAGVIHYGIKWRLEAPQVMEEADAEE